MCKQYEKHIHIIRNNEKVAYSTSCSDCFQKLLNNPEILEKLNDMK